MYAKLVRGIDERWKSRLGSMVGRNCKRIPCLVPIARFAGAVGVSSIPQSSRFSFSLSPSPARRGR